MKIYRHKITVNGKDEMIVNSQRKLTFTGLAKEVQAKNKKLVITSLAINKIVEEDVSIENL